MRHQLLFLPIVFFHFLIGFNEAGKNCDSTPVYSISQGGFEVAATLISPRHLVTSEYLFIDENNGEKFWSYVGEPVGECSQEGYRIVPNETYILPAQLDGEDLVIKQSLVFCDYAADEELKSYPMVIETEFPLNISISCLPTNGFVLNDGDQVKTVEYIPDEKKFKEIDLIINSSTPLNYSTVIKDSKAVPLDGTPLYYHSPSGSSVLIGIFYEKVGGKLNYHNVAFYEGKFCEILSICPALTTTPQTSIQLADSKDSDERKELNRYDDRLDVDKEYEEFLERRKGWDEQDDFDNDLFRSRDFKTASGRKKVILILLIVLMII